MKICIPQKNYRLSDLDHLVAEVYALLLKHDIVTFSGPLGAGKTTLVQKLLKRCGVTDKIVSPTFSYVHTYRVGEKIFHHFDLYRLRSMDDFIQAGFDEYLYQKDTKVLIEWPEILGLLVDRNSCHVTLDYFDADARSVSVCCSD